MCRIFISYSSQDSDWVRNWFLSGLENHDLKTHIDFRDFEVGVPSLTNMERAIDKCAKTILVLTPSWVKSDFANLESIMLQTEDPLNKQKKFLPLLLKACDIPRRLKPFTYADFQDARFHQTQLENLIKQIKKDLDAKSALKTFPKLPDNCIDIDRLPQTGFELYGRQKELELLNKAWEDDKTHVVSFVAYGGVGKSTLVKKWVEKMRWDHFRGADKVFAWSFYSQGTGERVTSADAFMNEALKWFGDPNPTEGDPWSKGERLAHMVQSQRTLLLLDGLEPLQSDVDAEPGAIKDPALSMLVKNLVCANTGLCVITTRVNVPELQVHPENTQQINLDQISPEAGRALLRQRGVRGSDDELEDISKQFGNHALAVNLLASYLYRLEGHPACKAFEIPDLDIPEEQGKHPRRVVEAMANCFGEGAHLELLFILGLFDQPAPQTAVDAVIQGEPLPFINEHLKTLDSGEWQKVLNDLREAKLLLPESHHNPNTLDCHPLIREHCGAKLKAAHPKAKTEAHHRLYEYYKNLPEKELPGTLAEMEPLFAAVAHGCQAELHQTVHDDIYFNRIRRKNEYYIVNQLCAIGSWISVISNFFDTPWGKINKSIRDTDQAVLLNNAGAALRAVGRLREAAEPMEAAIDLVEKNEDWENAASGAGNLSELWLTLGEVEQAVAAAERSVEYADKSGDEFWRMGTRTQLANALHQSGRTADSGLRFAEAEELQQKRQPDYKYLYSVQGYTYCDLLLTLGRTDEVLQRYEKLVEWRLPGDSLLDFSLEELAAGRAHLQAALTGSGDFEAARAFLNEAVAGLRKAGAQEFIVRGLLARAAFYRAIKEYGNAENDLIEAREITERGGMRLYLADYQLELSRLWLAQGRTEEAKPHVITAEEMIGEMGYHRHDAEVKELKEKLEI